MHSGGICLTMHSMHRHILFMYIYIHKLICIGLNMHAYACIVQYFTEFINMLIYISIRIIAYGEFITICYS